MQTQQLDIYADAEMHIVEGENHLLIKRLPEVVRLIEEFLVARMAK